MRTAIEPLRLRSSCAHCEQIPVMSTYVTILIDCAPSYPIDSYVWLIALCRGSPIGKNKGSEVYQADFPSWLAKVGHICEKDVVTFTQ